MTNLTETPPMPGTEHPSLTGREADFIRQWMSRRGQEPAVLMRPGDVMASYEKPSDPIDNMSEKVVFNIHKAAGPAPFVGDPRITRAMYVWHIASDEYGRSVGGSAELQWVHR